MTSGIQVVHTIRRVHPAPSGQGQTLNGVREAVLGVQGSGGAFFFPVTFPISLPQASSNPRGAGLPLVLLSNSAPVLKGKAKSPAYRGGPFLGRSLTICLEL
jgi:hypothetical protein